MLLDQISRRESMIKKGLFYVGVVVFLLSVIVNFAVADVLHLKDGRKIAGTVLEVTEDIVTIKTQTETRTYAMSQVDYIEWELGNETSTGESIELLYDDFSNPESGWEAPPCGSTQGAVYTCGGYQDGRFAVTCMRTDPFVCAWAPVEIMSTSFSVEVDTRCSKNPGALYGIVWGHNEDNLYYFGISTHSDIQWYGIDRMVNGDWVTRILTWKTGKRSINEAGKRNALKVVVSHGQVTLFANGDELESVSIGELSGPIRVGLAYGCDDHGLWGKAYFDNISIYENR
jgi:hypothetical protein